MNPAPPPGYIYDRNGNLIQIGQPQRPQTAQPSPSPMMFARPPAAAPAASPTGAQGGAAGGEQGASLMASPYAWLAAVLASGAALQHNNVSSVENQLRGAGGTDILESPNVKNWMNDTLGSNGRGTDVRRALRPITDVHDPSRWKQLPKDIWKGMKGSYHALANLV